MVSANHPPSPPQKTTKKAFQAILSFYDAFTLYKKYEIYHAASIPNKTYKNLISGSFWGFLVPQSPKTRIMLK